MTSKHYVSSVLSFLPENMRGLEDQAVGGSGAGNMGEQSRSKLIRFPPSQSRSRLTPCASPPAVVQPDLDSPVFIRCITECGPLRLPE